MFVCCFGVGVFNFWCECVQCLRGGVRFPNEVGVWWPSVYGGPNPKALHFQPWVGVGLEIGRHCTALTGAWPFTLNTKKNTTEDSRLYRGMKSPLCNVLMIKKAGQGLFFSSKIQPKYLQVFYSQSVLINLHLLVHIY